MLHALDLKGCNVMMHALLWLCFVLSASHDSDHIEHTCLGHRRTLARRLRDEARLHEPPGPAKRRLLRLLSGPRAIWHACGPLGSYFGVLIFLICVATVLSLVSIYPVVAASQQRSSDGHSYR
jgi:hypothetical protein